MFTVTSVSIILFFTSIVNVVIFIISWRRKNSNSGLYFALGMLGIITWTLCSALDYAAVPLALKIFFAKIEAVGYLSAISLFTLTSIAFAGNDHWLEKKWFKALLGLTLLINILLVLTNELHNWVWTEFEMGANNVVIFKHGPGFTWTILTVYPLVGLMFINFWMAFRNGSIFMRRQALLLAFALFVPMTTNWIYHLGLSGFEGVDWSSVTFSVSGTIFLYALYGMRFLDIIPIARDKLFNNLSDGMIVLDMQNRIADINNVATGIFNMPVIGENLIQVAPITSTMLNAPPEEELRTTIKTEEIVQRYFDIRLSPLLDGKKHIIGQLLIFRDITEMKQAENDLQQRLLEIERLNQELQESQAQVVDQQRSIATIAERQRLARDMHDSVNQSIHSLMLFSETLVALLQKNRAQEALETAERIQESGQRALKEIRLMLYRAQSVLINENTNLVDALEERLNMVERRVGITAKVIGADEIRKHCPAAWTDNLYWIIMEVLNNSLKHAQAQSVKIFFKYDSKQIEAEIADDGAGFDPEQIRAGGYGMKSMRERADLLGGYLTITSAPGCGTRVRIKIEMEN